MLCYPHLPADIQATLDSQDAGSCLEVVRRAYDVITEGHRYMAPLTLGTFKPWLKARSRQVEAEAEAVRERYYNDPPLPPFPPRSARHVYTESSLHPTLTITAPRAPCYTLLRPPGAGFRPRFNLWLKRPPCVDPLGWTLVGSDRGQAAWKPHASSAINLLPDIIPTTHGKRT